MGRGDAPTAVAIRLKKRRQARLDSGAFSETGLKAFVERLVGGRSMTTPLQVWPLCSPQWTVLFALLQSCVHYSFVHCCSLQCSIINYNGVAYSGVH